MNRSTDESPAHAEPTILNQPHYFFQEKYAKLGAKGNFEPSRFLEPESALSGLRRREAQNMQRTVLFSTPDLHEKHRKGDAFSPRNSTGLSTKLVVNLKRRGAFFFKRTLLVQGHLHTCDFPYCLILRDLGLPRKSIHFLAAAKACR